MNRPRTRMLLYAVGITFVPVAVDAGDLTPPPGPIVPTMKTLTEVEPRVSIQSLPGSATALHVINESGSYYLTGNITGISGKNGIEVSASNVTLNLNGFALIGVTGSLDGVSVLTSHHNLAIQDGTLSDWGGDGIDALNSTRTSLRNLHASVNGGTGILAGGETVVHGCVSSQNIQGIRVGLGSTISRSIADSNGSGNGIIAGSNSTIADCTARSNGDGIVGEAGSTIRGCTVAENSAVGIRIGAGGTVAGCTVTGSGLDGISAASNSNDGCTILDSTVLGSGQSGIVGGASSLVRSCATLNNAAAGIVVLDGSEVINCVSRGDQGIGIQAGNSCTVQGCTVTASGGDGIQVISVCRVAQNLCNGSGGAPGGGDSTGAGIHVTGRDCRIAENDLAAWLAGSIKVDQERNLIVQNFVSSGPVFVIVPGNTVAPITNNLTSAGPWDNLTN